MSLGEYTTVLSDQVELLASELAKQELPVIDQFEPIADFEELFIFSAARPTPIEFAEQHPAWQLESVAARVIEAIGIAASEPLDDTEWRSLVHILLEHTEYLWTYPDAPTARERLSAGIALALAGSVCASLPQSELWRFAGFGRIAANLSEVDPILSGPHVIQPLEMAFMLANTLNLPILDSAIACYNNVSNHHFTSKNKLHFPLSDKEVFHYLNLESQGLENVKSAFFQNNITTAISEYTAYRQQYSKKFKEIPHLEKTGTFSTAKSYLDCLRRLLIYPTPAILGTTEIGIAALLFPEFRFSEQLFVLVSRRYKWIVDAFLYPDGFHKNKSLRSQTETIIDFSRFLSIYDKAENTPHIKCVDEIKGSLEKQLEACIYISQPDLSFPPISANVLDNLDVVELCNTVNFNRKDFQYFASMRSSGNEPKRLSHALPYTGYYVMRDIWESDAQYLIFDSGGAGIHGNQNKLSFVLYAHGRQLITQDFGNESDDSSGIESGIHNVVLIDGKRQQTEPEIIPAPDTRWITTSVYDFVETWSKTTDYHHKRSIFYVKGEYFILHDLILGDGDHTLEQIFNLGTNCEQFTTPNPGQVYTREAGHSNILISAVDATNLTVQLNGNQLTYHAQRELPAVLNVMLFPMKPNEEHYPTVHSVAVNAEPDVLATGFTVKSKGITDIFLISDDGFAKMSTSETDEKIEFAGEYLFLRGDKFVILNGSFLKVGTKALVALDEPTECYMKF